MIYLFGLQKEAADIRSPTSMAEQKTCSKEGQKKLAEKTHVGASFLHEKKADSPKMQKQNHVPTRLGQPSHAQTEGQPPVESICLDACKT